MSDQEKTVAKAPEKKTVSSSYAELGGGVKIFFDRPLPKFDIGTVKAYGVELKSNQHPVSYALVCDKSLLPRLKQADEYTRVINPSLARLAEQGVVYWAPDKQEKHVFVYEGDFGEPFADKEGSISLGMNPNHVNDIVVPALVGVLQDCEQRSFFHGGFRLSNIYKREREGQLIGVTLGDAVTTPYAYAQPALYCTVSKGMADPIARGMGSNADDVYALGICLALMMRTNDPLAGMSDDEIIKKKLALGSYAAVTGKDRFTGSILELLRGILHDDPSQRWTVEEISTWLDGRRLTPKQHVKAKVASRPLVFGEKKYSQLAPLSMDLERNPAETVKVYESDELGQWIERSISDRLSTDRYEKVMANVGGRGTHYTDRVTSFLAMAMYPPGPIRYKQMKLMPDSLGIALLEAIETKKDIRPYVDMISTDIVLSWLTVQEPIAGGIDITGLISIFDSARQYLKKTKIGYGVERCLYLLCHQVHCLSPLFEGAYVYTASDLLFKLDKIYAQKKSAPRSILDRHMVAFLMEKESKVIDPYLFDLDASDDYRVVMANLSCFAAIQERGKVKAVPHLGKIFLTLLDPVYERFHDREARDKIKKQVTKHAVKGDLNEMLKTLLDPALARKDHNGFAEAMQDYNDLQMEYEKNEHYLNERKNLGNHFGRDVSALISCGVSVVIILIILMGGAG